MNKIALIENIEFSKLRFEKLFNQYNKTSIVTFDPTMIEEPDFVGMLEAVDMLIVDADSFCGDYTEQLGALKESDALSKMPIIVMSSNVDKTLLSKLSRYGIDNILLKPFEDLALLDMVLKYRSAPGYSDSCKVEKSIAGNMSVLSWDSVFSIGVDEVDAEHKLIFEKFAKLYNLMKEGSGHAYYLELLEFLKFYIEMHFEHEEKHQLNIGFSLQEMHKRLHQEFKDQVENIIENHRNLSVTNDDLVKISLFLKNWLIHHILVEDKKMCECLNTDA